MIDYDYDFVAFGVGFALMIVAQLLVVGAVWFDERLAKRARSRGVR